MAIKKLYNKFNVDFANAYHRIEWMNLNILQGNYQVTVQVTTYVDKDSVNSNILNEKTYILDINKAELSLAKCYQKLMEHDDFVNSVEE